MSELIPLLETLLGDAQAGRPVALCAVVKTRGSTPRSPGAAMLLRADGAPLGTLGGGYVEADVQRQALELLENNESRLLDFGLDHSYADGAGPICGGHMSVAVVSITPETELEPFQEALEQARRRRPASVPLVVKHEGKRLAYRLHLEVQPTLLLVGAGHVGQAVARLAVGLGFHVVVIDERAEVAVPQRFPEGVGLVVGDVADALRGQPIDAGSYVVITTPGHESDQQALEAVVRRPAGYIGMIGSRRKSRTVLRNLAAAGVPQEQLDRVHTPIGLSIGAVTVPEIAVSIVAELVQVRRRKTPKLVEGPVALADSPD